MRKSDYDYTDRELAKARPLTPRVVKKIRDHASLMRWSDGRVSPGSLADTFWNRDMPRLLALADQSEHNTERQPE